MASMAAASSLPEPADPSRLMVRSFLHHSLREAPQSQPHPQPQSEAAPSSKVTPMAELIGGHRPYPRRLGQFDSVRGRPVLHVVDDGDGDGDGCDRAASTAAWAWTVNANTLWRPLDTFNGLEYATVIAARRRQRQRCRQQPPGEAEEGGQVGLLQLRQFARQFGVGDDGSDGEEGGHPCAATLPRQRRPRTARPSTSASGRRSSGRLRPSSTSSRRSALTPVIAADAAYTDDADAAAQWRQQQELAVLCLLCQVLRTDDPALVQAWLAGATEREKALVADVIRTAMDSWQRQQQQPQTPLPPRTPKRVDRLVIEHGLPAATAGITAGDPSYRRCVSAADGAAGRRRGSWWPIRLLPPTSPPPPSAGDDDNEGTERLQRRRPRWLLRQQHQQQQQQQQQRPPLAPVPAAAATPADQLGQLCSKLRYTRIDPSLQPDGRTGQAWRLGLGRGPRELWARLG